MGIHFVSFRNSQIELRLPTVRRPNKNPRLRGARRGGFYGPLNKVRFSCGENFSYFATFPFVAGTTYRSAANPDPFDSPRLSSILLLPSRRHPLYI